MTAAAPLALEYHVRIADAQAHLLEVELTVRARVALPERLVLLMPVWTPGSYLVREYARHVESLSARTPGGPVAARKVRKNAWAVDAGGAESLTVRYLVFANELTVRTNHVDTSHAYWNGAATYLVPEGATEVEATVTAHLPDPWDVATGLRPLDRSPGRATFAASSVDELMDAPFECGPMVRREVEVHGKPHHLAVWQTRHASGVDWDRVLADTRLIVETEARLLAGDEPPASAIPYDAYTFIWHVSPRGRGGLEHASSTSLLVTPSVFSSRGGYLDVLSLVAHELLHAWNVKRIRPAGLTPYDYERENYTRLLWWFEGATSYFDWRIVRLAGLCSPREYANHLAGELSRLAGTPGALVHRLSETSYDAWIKAYRPDENSLNSSVSYYLKGEVVSALLDLEIRARTRGRRSLDDVLRHLWRTYGITGRPVPEDGMLAVLEEVAGVALADVVTPWVESTAEVDPAPSLAKVGLVHERRRATRPTALSLGLRARTRGARPVIDSVVRGSPAARAGLDAGDELIAVAGRRTDEAGLEACLLPHAAGDVVDVVFARDGYVDRVRVDVGPPPLDEGRLALRADATTAELSLLDGWLGSGAAAALRGGVS